MDWITGIQNTIDYIEQWDCEVIPRENFPPPFRWLFSILCGYRLSEYIRNCYLTLTRYKKWLTDSPMNRETVPQWISIEKRTHKRMKSPTEFPRVD